MKSIDRILDAITMYRLVLYYLLLLVGAASLFGYFGILSYNPVFILGSAAFITLVSWITNTIFGRVYGVSTNVESIYISALILTLILTPATSLAGLPLLFWASVLTMASKYILTIKQKHIFNPVAVAVALTSFGFNGHASWWIGTVSMTPFALLGWLIVRKIRKESLMTSFFISSLMTMLAFSFINGGNLLTTIRQIAFASPIFFFAFVMLTEPLTTPPTKRLQTAYGVLVGVLFAPQFHIGGFYTTPETALMLGNIFSYLVSPKQKIISTVTEKIQIAPDMLDFLLKPAKKPTFLPGQYMEWTVGHSRPDSRGNRRYLTIASSPTEDAIRLGVKFYPNGSSYKKALLDIDPTTPIVGAQLSGDFTLPKNTNQKLVFIAGGIGITPFRSMIKYLIDTKQPRPITLFYSNRTSSEIVYADVFNQAYTELGIRTIYTLTDLASIPADWGGSRGRIDAAMIAREAPDYMERTFYLSGPHTMVESYRETLQRMGVPPSHIKTDFFPGFA